MNHPINSIGNETNSDESTITPTPTTVREQTHNQTYAEYPHKRHRGNSYHDWSNPGDVHDSLDDDSPKDEVTTGKFPSDMNPLTQELELQITCRKTFDRAQVTEWREIHLNKNSSDGYEGDDSSESSESDKERLRNHMESHTPSNPSDTTNIRLKPGSSSRRSLRRIQSLRPRQPRVPSDYRAHSSQWNAWQQRIQQRNSYTSGSRRFASIVSSLAGEEEADDTGSGHATAIGLMTQRDTILSLLRRGRTRSLRGLTHRSSVNIKTMRQILSFALSDGSVKVNRVDHAIPIYSSSESAANDDHSIDSPLKSRHTKRHTTHQQKAIHLDSSTSATESNGTPTPTGETDSEDEGNPDRSIGDAN